MASPADLTTSGFIGKKKGSRLNADIVSRVTLTFRLGGTGVSPVKP
jgi:hypothetical protein